MEMTKRNNKILVLALIAIFAAAVSLFVGRYKITPGDVFRTVSSFGELDDNLRIARNILVKVRLPRIVASLLIGSALSAAGASYQGIFKNPMVSPSLLGVASGAGFGAGVAILLGFGAGMIQGMAFLFGLLAVAAVYFMSHIVSKKMDKTLTLILTGVVISSAFTSLISLIKYVGDPYDDLPAITFWLLGSVADVRLHDLIYVGIPVLMGLLGLFLMRWKINLMTLDEEEAMSLGVDTGKFRGIVIILSTVITAAAVSICGMISWVGLIVPHIARMIVGTDYKRLMPASIFIGATFMLMLDDISRVMLSTEIPLGILTSLVGTPLFLYLMVKGKRSW